MLQMYGMHPQAGLKAIQKATMSFSMPPIPFFLPQQGCTGKFEGPVRNKAPTFFNSLFQTRLIRSQGVEQSLLKGAQVL